MTEVKAPDGYHLSADAQTVEVTSDDVQSVSFYDEPLAALTIRKQDAVTGMGLAGAVFSVRESGGRDLGLFTTGAGGAVDGTVTVSGLTPGISLVVTETKAPQGYAINDAPQTIRIQSGITNSLTFDNQPTATLLIRKAAADTDEPISGVRFKVIDGNGANIGSDDGIFTTDASGEIRIPGLNPGVTVKAREIEAAPGYVLDGTPQDIQTIAGQVQTLTFRNRRQGQEKIPY